MKTVGVIFGGQSAEHDVSIVTAISAVIKPLHLSSDYNPVPIYIAKEGSWYSDESLGSIEFYTSGDVENKLEKMKKQQLLFDEGLYLQKPGLGGKKVKIDIVFPAMHGTYGEDGSLMGLLRMAGVPFVGSDMAASAVAMDKVFSKELASAAGCLVTKHHWFTKSEYSGDSEGYLKKLKSLSYPVFVKPAHTGSSIGLTKVDSFKDVENALEVAFHYDDKVLVEEGVKNLIEVTLPIMGNDSPEPALLEQAILNEDGVFDFDTKYMQGGKKGGKGGAKNGEQGSQGYSVLPADIPKTLYEKAVETGIAAYKAVGCEGIARIDMLIDSKAKKVYFNEINPLPGSLYAHNWKKAGVSNVELVTRLLKLAEERAANQSKLNTVFETNFLSQF